MSNAPETVVWQPWGVSSPRPSPSNPLHHPPSHPAHQAVLEGTTADPSRQEPASSPTPIGVAPVMPFSPRFNDIYRSSGTNGFGGLDQARHVFLAGCDLLGDESRWRGKRQWRILETGFGLGLNFLATWQAWRDDPQAPEHLHYVSVEAHPVSAQDLLHSVQAWPELHDLAHELMASYWGMLPGFHSLLLGQGRVHLTLIVADVQEAMKNLDGEFDSVYLDGFSPLKNPQMWSALTLKGVASHCRIGTQVATWSVSKVVKESLSNAGFEFDIVPGLAPKREQLRATYKPHWLMHDTTPDAPSDTNSDPSCLVIGAGLAGASVARSLASRGWRVRVLDTRTPQSPSAPQGVGWDDQARPLADGAHGLPMALFHPMSTGDDNIQSRLIRAGIRMLLSYCKVLDPHSSLGIEQVTGVREYKKPSKSNADQALLAQQTSARMAVPFYSDWSQEESRIGDDNDNDIDTEPMALWHRAAGWLRPQAFIAKLLDHPNIETLSPAPVLHLEALSPGETPERWRVVLAPHHPSSPNPELRCQTLIVAAGPQTKALLSHVHSNPVEASQVNARAVQRVHEIAQSWPLQAIKGQITLGWMNDLEPTAPSGQAAPSPPVVPKDEKLGSNTPSAQSPQSPQLPDVPVHGSISWTPNIELKSPKGLGFFIGSTFERDQTHIQNSLASRLRNLSHLLAMFPTLHKDTLNNAEFHDWSGVRSTCPDRLPLCGPMALQSAKASITTPTLDPTSSSTPAACAAPDHGLYVVSALGSRGVALCTLMAEVLSAHLNGEPQAVPKRLLKAIDPQRFANPI